MQSERFERVVRDILVLNNETKVIETGWDSYVEFMNRKARSISSNGMEEWIYIIIDCDNFVAAGMQFGRIWDLPEGWKYHKNNNGTTRLLFRYEKALITVYTAEAHGGECFKLPNGENFILPENDERNGHSYVLMKCEKR